MQVVLKQRQVDYRLEDWRELDEASQEMRLAEYLAHDKERGFDLSRDVLVRIRLFRIADQAYRCVWSQHHILMDGWCLSILLQELTQTYESLEAGQTPNLPGTRPYSHYIKWIEAQNRTESRTYWQDYLTELKSANASRLPNIPVGQWTPD